MWRGTAFIKWYLRLFSSAIMALARLCYTQKAFSRRAAVVRFSLTGSSVPHGLLLVVRWRGEQEKGYTCGFEIKKVEQNRKGRGSKSQSIHTKQTKSRYRLVSYCLTEVRNSTSCVERAKNNFSLYYLAEWNQIQTKINFSDRPMQLVWSYLKEQDQ